MHVITGFISIWYMTATHVESSTATDQATAAFQLIERLVGPTRVQAFNLTIAPTDDGTESFTLAPGPCCTISGSSGVALASGFNWYLKYIAKREVSYPLDGEDMLNISALPKEWPPIPKLLKQTSLFKWRYYMNVVTHSYSASFWDLERWMQEIDWMALSGVNLPLAFTGQEYAFYRTYTEKFGMTSADLDSHFAGPAFLAWGRMGNIRGWGGRADAYPTITGLTMHFMMQQRDLQKQIVARERSLGMHTVLTAFAGHVPVALKTRFPNASVSNSPGWCGFSNGWSHVPLLDASDPLFKEISRAFVEIQKEEYGFDPDGVQYFNGDNFNEMSPSSWDPSYLAAWGDAMYAPLRDVAGTGAGWFVQGWSLGHWADKDLLAYWSKVPPGKLLNLDLNCAMNGGSFKKYTDTMKRETVCGLLEDFGGRRTISGGLSVLSRQSIKNAQYSKLLNGLGWDPEDLHSNPIQWALLADVAWRSNDTMSSGMIVNISDWVQEYAFRRYTSETTSSSARAHVAKAWMTLLDSAYGGHRNRHDARNDENIVHDQSHDLQSLSDKNPHSLNSTTHLGTHSEYFSKDGLARFPSIALKLYSSPNSTGLMQAWSELVAAADADPSIGHGSAFRYDLVDVVRQNLQNIFAHTFATLQSKCQSWMDAPPTYTQHAQSNCGGSCLPDSAEGTPNHGHCDRMPGCGHDAGLAPCDPEKLKARCNAARPYKGVNCTAFNTNGYLYHGARVTPFRAYNLSCYVLNVPAPDMRACEAALAIVETDALASEASTVMALVEDLDRVLLTDKHFLMKNWITSARKFGNTSEEQGWLEWNARVQVTSWGSWESNHNTIADYASKQWGGLVGSFHLPLWRHFFTRMHDAAAKNITPSAISADVQSELYMMAARWTNSTDQVPGLSTESSVDVAKELLDKWRYVFEIDM